MNDHRSLKILYHHRTQGRGAEGVHIASIARAFESLGHAVEVVSPPGIDPLQTEGNAPVDKSEVETSGFNSLWKFISRNLPNFVFELIEIFYNIPAYFRLRQELLRKDYDLIYERYAFFLVAGAILSRQYGIPLILEANEVSGIPGRARKQVFERTCSRFESFLFRHCRSIHTVSSYLKSLILQHGCVDSNRVYVTPNAIDASRFGNPPDATELASALGLQGKFIMGFAGWFDEWDRLDLLLQNYVELKSKYPELALLLIGDGDVLNPVRQRVSVEGIVDVVMTGAVPRSEVHRYISLLDVAVITHSNEYGSPVVMFEFMGMKIPIIAPSLLPITDVLTDGRDAMLFEPMNMEQCRTSLSRLLEDTDTRKEIAETAYEKLLKEHTWLQNAEYIIRSSGV